MFDMFVREYFDNSLIPLSDTIEAFVFRRDNIVQAGNRTATRISRVQFGIRMLLVIQNLVFRTNHKAFILLAFLNQIFHTAICTFRQLELKAQLEGAKLIDCQDITTSFTFRTAILHNSQFTIFNLPSVFRECFLSGTPPSVRSLTVKQQFPTGRFFCFCQRIRNTVHFRS